jgi:Fe2+ transport system protein FeoA
MAMPPDLDRLGEQLVGAAGHTLDKRRRRSELRRRMATAGIIGGIAFAVLTPAPLGPAVRTLSGATLASTTERPWCDLPRGTGFRLERCAPAAAAVPHRPYAWR